MAGDIFVDSSQLFVVLVVALMGVAMGHPAVQNQDAVAAYRRSFDLGYFPFTDTSTPSEQTENRLANIRNCNQVFADYLRANKSRITLTPPDHPFKVSTLLVIANLYKMSEKDQTVTLTTFIEMSWRDRRLANIGGRQCANVTRVLPNLSSIFFPVFTIENSAERVLYNEAWEKFPVAVYGKGVVVWIISLRLVLNCKMNMKTFPFDSQNCHILIRSPHYFQSELQYYVYNRSMALLLMHENVRHPLWEINGQMPRLTTSNISGLEIWFRLDRKPSFYVWTLIIPTLIVSISTCLPFILPSCAEEKMQTCLSGILAYFLLLMTMVDVTPQTSEDIPLLTLFYVIIIGLGMTGALVCALIVRLANRERKQRHLDRSIKKQLQQQQQMKVSQSAGLAVSANHESAKRMARDTSSTSLGAAISLNNTERETTTNRSSKYSAERRMSRFQRFNANYPLVNKLLSAKYLNDIFLLIYITALIMSYIWLFAYMTKLNNDIAAANAAVFKFTPVMTYH